MVAMKGLFLCLSVAVVLVHGQGSIDDRVLMPDASLDAMGIGLTAPSVAGSGLPHHNYGDQGQSENENADDGSNSVDSNVNTNQNTTLDGDGESTPEYRWPVQRKT